MQIKELIMWFTWVNQLFAVIPKHDYQFLSIILPMIEINYEVKMNSEEMNFHEEFSRIYETTMKLLKRKEKRLVIINFVSEKEIQTINKEFRNNDRITDVISVGFDDKLIVAPILGEIYICIAQAKRQSLAYNHSVKREICFLFLHGLLHVLGFDHLTEDESKVMFKWQDDILSKCKIEREK